MYFDGSLQFLDQIPFLKVVDDADVVDHHAVFRHKYISTVLVEELLSDFFVRAADHGSEGSTLFECTGPVGASEMSLILQEWLPHRERQWLLQMLDNKEERVVHDLQVLQELRITLEAHHQNFQVALTDANYSFWVFHRCAVVGILPLYALKNSIQILVVDILEDTVCLNEFEEVVLTLGATKLSFCGFRFHIEHITCHSTTLEVKLKHTIAFERCLESVLHHHYVEWDEVVGFDGEQSINPRKHRLVLHLDDVAQVIHQNHVKKLHFVLSQRFDYEAMIVGKEKEAAAGTGALLCPEYLHVILLNIQ